MRCDLFALKLAGDLHRLIRQLYHAHIDAIENRDKSRLLSSGKFASINLRI